MTSISKLERLALAQAIFELESAAELLSLTSKNSDFGGVTDSRTNACEVYKRMSKAVNWIEAICSAN